MTLSRSILATTALLASLAAAPAVLAQPPAAPTSSHRATAMDEGAMLERHIAHMHDVLMVTPQQEDQWQRVAQTMRDNEKAAHELIRDRQSRIASQNAVEDLNAYADIAAQHAQATRKLADVFAGFYAGLSDDQKKAADELFRSHKRRAMQAHGRPPAQPQ